MDPDRQAAIRAVERTLAANKALREGLRRDEVIGRRMLRELRNGTPIQNVVVATGNDPAEVRATTNELVDDFERSRHAARLVFIGQSVNEGVSIGQIGKDLGVSRQLAARLALEAEAASPDQHGIATHKRPRLGDRS